MSWLNSKVRKKLLIGLLILLISALTENTVLANSQVSKTKPTLMLDCMFQDYKPTYLPLSCDTGSSAIKNIHWQTWTSAKAEGVGTELIQIGAYGNKRYFKVRLTLLNAIKVKDQLYFTQLLVKLDNNLETTSEAGESWDLLGRFKDSGGKF